MTQYERMVGELPYYVDDELREIMMNTKLMTHEYNQLSPDNLRRRTGILKKLLGKTGERVHIEQPFHCDYGHNIQVGENFYANYNLTILDCNKVKIGDNVMCAPNVLITTAGHPIHPLSRTKSWYEYAIPVTIGNNVWLGANVVVNPGVTIGDGTVIGAGSVVTHDIPSNVVAFGNPCKVYREITDEDRDFYYKNRKFDVTDY